MSTPVPTGVRHAHLLDEAFLRRLERLSLRTRRVAGLVGGRPGSRRTPAADYIDHRPYSPGDDQRHIDWPAVARHDEVFVKVGHVAQAADVYLVVDLSPSVVTVPAKRAMVLELAAALGWMSLAHGDRVALLPLPEGGPTDAWGPKRGGGSGADFVTHLADLSPPGASGTSVAPVLESLSRRAPVGGLLVLITDLWLDDDLGAALARVPPPRWHTMVLHVLGRGELEPRLSGLVELRDAEDGRRVTVVVDDAARAAYRAEMNARLERLRLLVHERGASYTMVPDDWSLEQAVIPFLQRRAILST